MRGALWLAPPWVLGQAPHTGRDLTNGVGGSLHFAIRAAKPDPFPSHVINSTWKAEGIAIGLAWVSPLLACGYSLGNRGTVPRHGYRPSGSPNHDCGPQGIPGEASAPVHLY